MCVHVHVHACLCKCMYLCVFMGMYVCVCLYVCLSGCVLQCQRGLTQLKCSSLATLATPAKTNAIMFSCAFETEKYNICVVSWTHRRCVSRSPKLHYSIYIVSSVFFIPPPGPLSLYVLTESRVTSYILWMNCTVRGKNLSGSIEELYGCQLNWQKIKSNSGALQKCSDRLFVFLNVFKMYKTSTWTMSQSITNHFTLFQMPPKEDSCH